MYIFYSYTHTHTNVISTSCVFIYCCVIISYCSYFILFSYCVLASLIYNSLVRGMFCCTACWGINNHTDVTPCLGTVFCWKQVFWPSWWHHVRYCAALLLHMILWPSGWPAGCSSGLFWAPEWVSWPAETRAGGISQVWIYFLDISRKSLNVLFGIRVSVGNSLIFCAALSRHYDTQASPTPLAWYAYQLPDWLSRLGAVCILAVEIGVPLLMFFIPVRGLRINAFCILVWHPCKQNIIING